MAPTKRVDNEKGAHSSVQNGRIEKKNSPGKAGGGPAKAVMTALQRIPTETLLDALVHLDRGQLETLQLTSTHFKTIVETEMNDLCLRPIKETLPGLFGPAHAALDHIRGPIPDHITVSDEETHVNVSVEDKTIDVQLKPLKPITQRSGLSVEQYRWKSVLPGPSGTPEDALGPLIGCLRHAVVVGRFGVRDCQLTTQFLDAYRGLATK